MLILWNSFLRNRNKIWQLYSNKQKSEYSPAYVVCPTRKASLSVATPRQRLATHLCALQKPLQYLARQCWHTHPTVMTLRHQILTYVKARKTVCDRAITRTTRRYITPCVGCCRENTATFTGREYVLLFKDERLLTMRKTILTHKSACSNIAVKSSQSFRYVNYSYISWNSIQNALLDD